MESVNKYLIMTGGSKGIGKKTIELFQQHQWKIINISRTNCELPEVINLNIDLTFPETLVKHTSSLEHTLQNAAQICLVHNAAIYNKDSVDTISQQELTQTLNANLISAALLNKMIIPLMPPASSIIYIGSVLATKAVRGSASYIISKHALIGLMRATCQDLMDRDIHTCCICPGLVDTDLLREAVDEPIIQHILATEVIGKRLIEPEEIARLIHFCADNQTINGAVINANLGQSA
jgi:3-oxoacyl-[acyl-carrier protein] reductase